MFHFYYFLHRKRQIFVSWWAVFEKIIKNQNICPKPDIYTKAYQKSSSPKDLKIWPEKWSLRPTSMNSHI